MPRTTVIDVCCMCDNSSTLCTRSIQLSLEELQKILQKDLLVVVDGCQNVASSTDVFVEQRSGYALYKES